jgi:transcriptional regulator with XRE-family HTH domain
MTAQRSLAVAERFGANLRRVRRREGLSQEGLAVRASLHRTEIGRLEGGERACRIDTLIRLAGAMAVPPDELLDGDRLGACARAARRLRLRIQLDPPKLISEWPTR